MSDAKYLPRGALLTVIGLGVSACDSSVDTDSAEEPVAAAALELATDNLLVNGGFESPVNGDSWRTCSSVSGITTYALPSEGSGALSLSNGACLSQSTAAVAGATYTLSCEGRVAGSGNSTVTFGFVDAGSATIESQENVIASTDYTTIVSTITAPPSAASAEVMIVSDGEAAVDNCSLIRLADSDLLNGDFSLGLTGWQMCDNTAGDVAVTDNALEPGNNQLSVSNGGCVYQLVDMTEILASDMQNLNLDLTCDTDTDGSGYASITLGYRDANFQPISINVENVITGSTDGVFKSDLTVPFDTRFAEVQIYSTSVTNVDNCGLSHLAN